MTEVLQLKILMHLVLIHLNIKQTLDLIFTGEMMVDSSHSVMTKRIMKTKTEL